MYPDKEILFEVLLAMIYNNDFKNFIAYHPSFQAYQKANKERVLDVVQETEYTEKEVYLTLYIEYVKLIMQDVHDQLFLNYAWNTKEKVCLKIESMGFTNYVNYHIADEGKNFVKVPTNLLVGRCKNLFKLCTHPTRFQEIPFSVRLLNEFVISQKHEFKFAVRNCYNNPQLN